MEFCILEYEGVVFYMETIIASETFKIICRILIILLKALYAVVIYFKCNCDDKKTRNVLTYLSIPFPIIVGIICLTKYKKSIKDSLAILITLIAFLASVVLVGYVSISNFNNSQVKYYDKDGTAHAYAFDVSFTDIDGNKYSFDFDKAGYDLLYINATDEYLDADFCYLDSNGYIHYDDDKSITAKDETCCVDEDGTIYYPAKFTTFNEDGTIKYVYNSANFKYDRLGKAYIHKSIPYYDADGNKYFYSFDSATQKGTYTKFSTGETYENEYSFVDENGFFVYDKEHSFVQQKDITNVKTYKDSAGKIYYWASGVFWNENAELLDSYGEVIK